MKDKYIYRIQAYEGIDVRLDDDFYYVNRSDCRQCFGYFKSLKVAKDIVINNVTDIFECCYEHIIIYKIRINAMYDIDVEKWLYKYNFTTEKYDKIEFSSMVKESDL